VTLTRYRRSSSGSSPFTKRSRAGASAGNSSSTLSVVLALSITGGIMPAGLNPSDGTDGVFISGTANPARPAATP
jgi:hypothetical protein